MNYLEKIAFFESHSESQGCEAKDSFKCPISLELMRDPVINLASQTYERKEIICHYRSAGLTDPVTNTAVASDLVIPNLALRKEIHEFLDAFCRRMSEVKAKERKEASQRLQGDVSVEQVLATHFEFLCSVPDYCAAGIVLCPRDLDRRTPRQRVAVHRNLRTLVALLRGEAGGPKLAKQLRGRRLHVSLPDLLELEPHSWEQLLQRRELLAALLLLPTSRVETVPPLLATLQEKQLLPALLQFPPGSYNGPDSEQLCLVPLLQALSLLCVQGKQLLSKELIELLAKSPQGACDYSSALCRLSSWGLDSAGNIKTLQRLLAAENATLESKNPLLSNASTPTSLPSSSSSQSSGSSLCPLKLSPSLPSTSSSAPAAASVACAHCVGPASNLCSVGSVVQALEQTATVWIANFHRAQSSLRPLLETKHAPAPGSVQQLIQETLRERTEVAPDLVPALLHLHAQNKLEAQAVSWLLTGEPMHMTTAARLYVVAMRHNVELQHLAADLGPHLLSSSIVSAPQLASIVFLLEGLLEGDDRGFWSWSDWLVPLVVRAPLAAAALQELLSFLQQRHLNDSAIMEAVREVLRAGPGGIQAAEIGDAAEVQEARRVQAGIAALSQVIELDTRAFAMLEQVIKETQTTLQEKTFFSDLIFFVNRKSKERHIEVTLQALHDQLPSLIGRHVTAVQVANQHAVALDEQTIRGRAGELLEIPLGPPQRGGEQLQGSSVAAVLQLGRMFKSGPQVSLYREVKNRLRVVETEKQSASASNK
eukprot:g80811.t1